MADCWVEMIAALKVGWTAGQKQKATKLDLMKAGLMALPMCLVGRMADYWLVQLVVKTGWVQWMVYYSAG